MNMRNDKRRPGRTWTGLLAERSPTEWVEYELDMEEMDESGAMDELPTQPVSVRLDVHTIAMLDAFTRRFRLTRSALLTRLIGGGLSEAFHALPEKEQLRMLEAVKDKIPTAELMFETSKAAKGRASTDEAPAAPPGSSSCALSSDLDAVASDEPRGEAK